MEIDDLPEELCLAQLCSFLALSDRWRGLARVSRRWRQLALLSAHTQHHLDLTWCTREHELEVAAKQLAQRHSREIASQLISIGLYGPRVTTSLLDTVMQRVGIDKLQCVAIESKQVDSATLNLLAACTSLRRLTLDCIKLTDATLVVIAKRAGKLLTAVDLSGCARIGDDGVVALAKHANALQEFKLAMCHRVTDRAVMVLASRPPNSLIKLNVDRCIKISGPALCLLLRKQRALRRLSFSHCPKIHSSDVQCLVLSKGHKPVPTVCSLIALDLSGCAGLDDAAIVTLVGSNRATLRELNISSLVSASSPAFAAVAQCSELRWLDLSLCRGLQNADLERVAAGCHRLQTLLLQGCVCIDDAGLRAFAPLASSLVRLTVEFCYNITDVGFQALVEHCPRLVNLNVTACNQLTAAAFEALARHERPEEHRWRIIYIGAVADLETTAEYCAIIKRSFPRCCVHWV